MLNLRRCNRLVSRSLLPISRYGLALHLLKVWLGDNPKPPLKLRIILRFNLDLDPSFGISGSSLWGRAFCPAFGGGHMSTQRNFIGTKR